MAKFNIEIMRRLRSISTDLIKAHTTYDKMLLQMLEQDITPSRRNSLRNRIERDAEYMEDQLHEMHCLVVELGIAAPEEWRYGEKEIISSNGWSRLLKLRRRPEI